MCVAVSDRKKNPRNTGAIMTNEQKQAKRLIETLADAIGCHAAEFAGCYWRDVLRVAERNGFKPQTSIRHDLLIQWPIV